MPTEPIHGTSTLGQIMRDYEARLRSPSGSIRNEPPGAFDFATHWDTAVVPHLDDAELNQILHAGLQRYVDENRPNTVYDPAKGPWAYCPSDAWSEYCSEQAEASGALEELHIRFGLPVIDQDSVSDEDIEALDDFLDANPEISAAYHAAWEEIEVSFEPKPGTIEYYQAWHCCHWMVDWQVALASRIMPELTWKALRGPHHSTAVGYWPKSRPTDRSRKPAMVFDLLRAGEDATQTLWDARRRK